MAMGFPKATMTPLAAGGRPPYGEDMNGILAMLSIAARASEAGLLRPFSAVFANAIGGYPSGATVAHPSVQGRFLICVMDGNTNDPGNSMTGWVDPLQFTVQSRTSEGNLQVQSIGVQQSTNQIWMRTNDGTFYHAPTDGQYATPADLVGVVRSPDDGGDYQINSCGVNKSNGQIWLYNGASGKFFYPALPSDVQAERVRAQNAEAAIQGGLTNVVRSNADDDDTQVQFIGIDKKTGQIWMADNDGTFHHAPTDGQYATPADLVGVVRSNADSNDLQIRFIGAQANTGALWFGAGDGKFFHPAMAGDLQAEQMRAQSAEAALQPAGNYVRATGSAYRKIQTKTVSAVHGDWIYFDEPFNDDDVQVVPFPQDGGNNRIHQANWFEKNRTGWRISLNAWTGSTYENEKTPTLVMYVAYGYGG
ncbi:hypothetical protein DTI93_06645 [Parasaccharibacter sp. TMW 2.1884]|nr:hypothetical protein [Parasaccharibacter sp. TMW 2.1884]